MWVSLAFVAALIVYWSLQPRENHISRNRNIPHLSASGLFDRYVSNEVATQNLFGNDTLIVSGTVLEVDAEEKDLSIAFRHDRGDFIAARAFVAKVYWPQASRLKPGTRTTVQCDRAVWLGDAPALLIGCEL